MRTFDFDLEDTILRARATAHGLFRVLEDTSPGQDDLEAACTLALFLRELLEHAASVPTAPAEG